MCNRFLPRLRRTSSLPRCDKGRAKKKCSENPLNGIFMVLKRESTRGEVDLA